MKKKVVILFGGKSYEHDISIESARSVLKHMNRKKYEIKLIYIDKNGKWFLCHNIDHLTNLIELVDFKLLKWCDVVFPILHGNYGEDGKLQGLFEVLGINYIGCNLISSALCMDKVFSKLLLTQKKIPNTKFAYYNNSNYDLDKTLQDIKNEIGYPCFIKPANAGSSIGINKVYHEREVDKFVKEAFKYDNKILIEEYIHGREVEVGLLGNEEVFISNIGEIIPADDFYSYDAKYNNKESIIKIPAYLKEEIKKQVKQYAKEAYQLLECQGLARIDFFIQNETNKIFLNEINTLPGFTAISMYPVLFESIGIKFEVLIDKIIELGLKKTRVI